MAEHKKQFLSQEVVFKLEERLSERFMKLVEEEAVHLRWMDAEAFKEARRGQLFAFLIGLTAIIAGATTSIWGQPIAGTFIGAGGVVGLVAVFIKGR